MRADAASRTENLTKLIAARVLTPNEARAILNLAPRADGDELVNPHTISGSATPSQTPTDKEAAE